MNQLKRISKRTHLISSLFVLMLGVLFLLYSCKSGEKKGTTDTTTVIPIDTTNTNIPDSATGIMPDTTFTFKIDQVDAAGAPDEIDNLTLSKAQLETIFNTKWRLGPVVALRFDFYHREGKKSLTVCGLNDNATNCTGYFALTPTDGSSVTNKNKLHRIQQLITRGELKVFLGLEPGTPTPIPEGEFVNMYFKANQNEDPKSKGEKLLFFDYSDKVAVRSSKEKINVEEGSGASNPSPPFTPPCGGQCDEAAYRK